MFGVHRASPEFCYSKEKRPADCLQHTERDAGLGSSGESASMLQLSSGLKKNQQLLEEHLHISKQGPVGEYHRFFFHSFI